MDRRHFLALSGAAAVAASLPAGCAAPRTHVGVPGDDLLEDLVEAAISQGATYADARFVITTHRNAQVRKDRIHSVMDGDDAGIALRVFRDGGWGQSACSDLFTLSPRIMAAEALAAAAVTARVAPLGYSPEGRVRGVRESWSTPLVRDPFDVPVEEITSFLRDITRKGGAQPRIEYAVANMFARRRELHFFSSLDAHLTQKLTHVWVNAAVTAFDQSSGRIDTRTSRFEPQAGGWELVNAHPFLEEIERAAHEAVAMQSAAPLAPMRYDLVMHPSHHWHVVHRLLAPQLDPAAVHTTDGLNPAHRLLHLRDIGGQAFTSAQLTVDYDDALRRGTGSFRWDDGGRPAGQGTVVENGIYRGFPLPDEQSRPLSSHSADISGQGRVRAASWQSQPRFTMPNLRLRPSASPRSLEAIIADTQLGILLAGRGFFNVSTDRSWFRASSEQAWLIENGTVKGMVRDFEYEARIKDFFGALAEVSVATDAVAGADLFPTQAGENWDLPFSISTPAARYSNISTFSNGEARP